MLQSASPRFQINSGPVWHLTHEPFCGGLGLATKELGAPERKSSTIVEIKTEPRQNNYGFVVRGLARFVVLFVLVQFVIDLPSLWRSFVQVILVAG